MNYSFQEQQLYNVADSKDFSVDEIKEVLKYEFPSKLFVQIDFPYEIKRFGQRLILQRKYGQIEMGICNDIPCAKYRGQKDFAYHWIDANGQLVVRNGQLVTNAAIIPCEINYPDIE